MGRDSKALWIITKDHIFNPKYGGESSVGRRSMAVGENPDTTGWVSFKLYDDDDELYYEGLSGSLNEDESLAFEPLDWAAAHAGATRLDYLNPKTGKWETL